MVLDENPHAGISVLVVEDEPMLLMVAAEALREAGYVVWEALDGHTALKILEEEPQIALMLTDVKMHGMDGYTLAEASVARRPDLKILLMTGYLPSPLPKSMAEAGVRILQKPFDIDSLPRLVGEILENR